METGGATGLDSTGSTDYHDVRISISVNDVPQTGADYAPQVVAPVVLTPHNAR